MRKEQKFWESKAGLLPPTRFTEDKAMIQGIAERLDSLVQSLNVAGTPKTAPASHPADGKPVAQLQNGPDGAQAQKPSANEARPEINKDTLDRINKQLQAVNPQVSVSVDNEAKRYILRYKDPKSGEVIQQLPSESMLEMMRQLNGQKGLIFNSKG
jgi:uncharacterized FlaG/YvyC family protein